MKTLLFTNLYPSQKAPTRGVFHQHVYGALRQHCDVRLIAPLPWWTRCKQPELLFKPPVEDHTGISASFPTYWSIPNMHRLHGRGMYLSVRGLAARIRRDFPFEAILASWVHPDAYAAALLAREFDVPLVTNALGSDINALVTYPNLRPMIEFTLRQSQRIISVSGALAQRIEELGVPAEKIVVQHNGVDDRKFRLQDRDTVRKRVGIDHSEPMICYVGNFVEEKGVHILVEAMHHLAERGERNVHLALIGSGSLEPRLHALAAQYGMQGRIHFYGRRVHDEIPDWMSAADVFCLPSLREGCPNVVLEALSSGRPVVASNVGGVPELLTSAQGELVSANDPRALAQGLESALRRAWSPDELRSAVGGRTWSDVGRGYYEALEFAVNQWQGTKVPNRPSKEQTGMRRIL